MCITVNVVMCRPVSEVGVVGVVEVVVVVGGGHCFCSQFKS